MKQLLILTTLIFPFIISSVAHAEWTQVLKNKKHATTYVDFDRIRRHDGKTYYWVLENPWEFAWKYKPYSQTYYFEAECGPFRERILTISRYKSFMAKGIAELEQTEPDTEWYYPLPNSTEETILKAVCTHDD